MRRPLFALLAGAVLLVPRLASAFTCSPTQDGRFSQVWMSRCIPYSISTNGMLLDGEERRRLIAQSFDVWSSKQNPCTDLTFKDVGYTDQLSSFSADSKRAGEQRNVVAAIEDTADLDEFDDPRLLALTLTRYSIATGEILDADILLNAVRFRFDEVEDETACRSGPMPFDLRNTLVHEIGHFIGFDHVLIDDATMFASAEACEILKRDLDADDRSGLCTVYPSGQATRTCAPPPDYSPSGALDPRPYRNQCERRPGIDTTDPGGCSCAAANREGPAGAIWLLLGAALWLGARRRAR